jgi:hypothetical protein
MVWNFSEYDFGESGGGGGVGIGVFLFVVAVFFNTTEANVVPSFSISTSGML